MHERGMNRLCGGYRRIKMLCIYIKIIKDWLE